MIPLKKTVTPAQTKAEILAQFRKRINPMIVKIPRTAKPRKEAEKSLIWILQSRCPRRVWGSGEKHQFH
jgi:hypothetical protein